jgi:exonuclease-1
VKFVVAPYEADAQLAYLCRLGEIQAVITEDSDLLAFGCERVCFLSMSFTLLSSSTPSQGLI